MQKYLVFGFALLLSFGVQAQDAADVAVDASVVVAAPVVDVPAAPPIPEAMPEGMDLLEAIINAAQGGQWSLFVSFLIMFIVYLATKAPGIKNFIKGEAKIWVAAVAGILAAFAGALFEDVADGGGVNWLNVVLQGFSVGLAAGGLWSLIGRKIAGTSIDKDGDGVLDSIDIQDDDV